MPLLLLLAAGALLWTVWVYERTRPSPGSRWRTILISLRVISLLLLLLAAAGPVLTRLVQRATGVRPQVERRSATLDAARTIVAGRVIKEIARAGRRARR